MTTWNYSNTAVGTSLNGGINGVTTSIVVTSISGFPVSYPYTLIIEPDEANREIITVTAGASTTLTVVRGADGTSASAHSSGAQVVHGIVARDVREAQVHIAAATGVHGTTGDLVGTSGTQVLTDKSIDGGANTLTNISTSSLVGTFPANQLSGTFDGGLPAISAPLNTRGIDLSSAVGSRTAYLAKFANVTIGDDLNVGLGGVDLTTEARALSDPALTQRIYSKNGTSKPALVLDRATANTDNLLVMKANGSTIATYDKDAIYSGRSVTANQITADTTTKLFDAKNSSAVSVFSVNYQGNIVNAGSTTTTGAITGGSFSSAGTGAFNAVTSTTSVAVGTDLTINSLSAPRGLVVGANIYSGGATQAASTGTEQVVASASWGTESTYSLPTGRLYKIDLRVNTSLSAATDSATTVRVRKGAQTTSGTLLAYWYVNMSSDASTTAASHILTFYFKNTSGSTVATKLSLTNARQSGAATTQFFGDTNIPIVMTVEDVGAVADHSALATLAASV